MSKSMMTMGLVLAGAMWVLAAVCLLVLFMG